MTADDLLAPFADGATRRARFSVRTLPPTILDPVDGLRTGAAEVDITPPPGKPRAGRLLASAPFD